MAEKRIMIELPADLPVGARVLMPVLVSWFPSLTADQHLANAVAQLDGQPAPFPNPNLIEVEVEMVRSAS